MPIGGRAGQLLAILATVLAALVIMPLVGWPPVTRVAVILLGAGLLAVVLIRPWQRSTQDVARCVEWMPTPRTVWTAAGVVALLLFWIVLTRFRSGEINAV